MKLCTQCKQRYPDDSSFCFIDGSSLELIAEGRSGDVLANRYRLGERIGAGRYGTVYRATSLFSGQRFAIKVFGEGGAPDAGSLKAPLFTQELLASISLATKIVHPNVVLVFEGGTTEDGVAYRVSDLVEAEPLASMLLRGKLSVERALPIAIQIARALSRAHDIAVAHTDLTPRNIFVQKDGLVRVSDFAIARGLEPLRAPAYKSNGPPGPSSDLYSLGVVLLQAVGGVLPDPSPEAPVPRLSERARVPEELDALVTSLLQPTPLARPVDIHAVIGVLTATCERIGAPVPVVPDSAIRPSTREANVDQIEQLWQRRAGIFNEMAKLGFGALGPAPHVKKQLDEVTRCVAELGSIRQSAAELLRTADIVQQEGLDSLGKLGDAMSAVMLEASGARQEVRVRGGAVDAELAARLQDIDYQVKDLRGALDAAVADFADRKAGPQRELDELGKRWTDIEADLLSVAARFCAPLRARPELSTLFAKLA